MQCVKAAILMDFIWMSKGIFDIGRRKQSDVLIYSSLAAASFLAYGIFPPAHVPVETNPYKDLTVAHPLSSETVVCSTNNTHILSTWRHTPYVFLGKSSNQTAIFLSNNPALNDALAIYIRRMSSNQSTFFLSHNDATNDVMTSYYGGNVDGEIKAEKFAYNCHAFSTADNDVCRNDFVLKQTYIQDSYFRIEDVFNGKQQHVEQFVRFYPHQLGDILSVSITQKRRLHVKVDPYPEVHISVRSTANTRAFHWYL
ncbi:hypothetical protein DPMN_087732 [Dreissena polymorpha]|uniref:Uncharacterized protein n=1 Tax=Dreissena polymorpha TaxID=45954 RepID=A0A9D4KT78_DREPO|nr:hypothetical protein DPMN_087732 [Dreissena polymorpha]